MRIGKVLLKNVGKAALNLVSAGTLGDLVFDVADEAMANWSRDRDECQRRDEMQAIAQAAADEVRAEVCRIVDEIAADQPTEVREQLANYLTQVPSAIRRGLRRPDDLSGRTVPAGCSLKDGRDLAAFLPSQPPRFQSGDRPPGIANRQLVELLGVGGFGEVWRAVNPERTFAVPVALKFCLDENGQQLLKHEADILDRIIQQQQQHDLPGVVKLLDTYLSMDPPCLEYEFVEGGDLTSVIKGMCSLDGPQCASEAAAMILELAETVGHFHCLSPPIVHRDLKPANVLIEAPDGGVRRLKIADFGIGAAAAEKKIALTKRTSNSRQSLPSMLHGSHSPLYASPQQERGLPADPRDDVHALGVLWHQMLCGDTTRGAPRGRQWSRRLIDRGVDERHVDLLAACIEEEPEDRPAHAAELAELLRPLLGSPVTSTPAPTPPPEDAFWRRARPNLPPRKSAPTLEKTATPVMNMPKRRVTNSLEIEFVLIPSGETLLGSPAREQDRQSDEAQRHVVIRRPFYLATTPVTQEEFAKLMGRNPSRNQSHKARTSTGRCPVENVSWFDAVEFCNQLSLRDGLSPRYAIAQGPAGPIVQRLVGDGWRLPTEAEWEHACRAGCQEAWQFGADPSIIDDYAWHDRNSNSRTHGVARLKANGFGLFDMAGNVFEWCQDWHAAAPTEGEDPQGPIEGQHRVLRGGAWNSPASRCRSAYRHRGAPTARDASFGFRVARTLTE